ncbi:MAG: flagellar filament capping protein FliD [Lachnospiraceae bacterium]|nr:flagellar filament capping protein FliD [Lachnospiraceae bacterium]
MTMRITGMSSGLDTESIIAELVKAKSQKKVTLQKAQKKVSYQQEAWSTLNSKILNLYSKTINDLAYTTAYKQQKTSVSNTSIASVITGKDAVNGVQNLEVTSVAKLGYLTGAQLSTNGAYSKSTKLSEIAGSGIDSEANVTFSVTVGGETKDIKLNGDATISDVVEQLKNAGINANFDENNQRLFVSAKTFGKEADFALTASTDGGFKALSALGINIKDDLTWAQYEKYAGFGDISNPEAKELIDNEVARQAEILQNRVLNLENEIEERTKKIDAFLKEYGYADEDGNLNASAANLDTNYQDLLNKKEDLSIVPEDETEEAKKLREESLSEVEKDIKAYEAYQEEVSKRDSAVEEKTYAEGQLANDNAAIRSSVEIDMAAKISFADRIVNQGMGGFTSIDEDDDATATRILGQDAAIKLNGARFTSSSNNFEINGLTISVKAETAPGETVTLTTEDDYEAIYGTIKNFINEYNQLINEMDKLYNAKNANGYEPLSDEEKESMSDSEIEKWETTLKESILYRDSTLNEISNIFKMAMMSGFEVNGKTMYLFDFGINKAGYFNAADNERNAYHIDGDPDDATTMGNADVLKSMIANDPDTVISFFTQLSRKLYADIGEKMKSNDFSSYNKVYNDKQMQKEYDSYTTKIAEQEAKITAAEEKYYKQFSAMETALARLESKSNALTGLLGG